MLMKNWLYSDYSDEWCKEAYYSEYHSSYINSDNAIEVYLDVEQNKTDFRSDNDDDSYFHMGL